MDKKDRNVKPGDSDIVTKKGFLISPPKKSGKPSFFGKPEDKKDASESKNQKHEDKKPQKQDEKQRQKHNDRGRKLFNKHKESPQQKNNDKKEDKQPISQKALQDKQINDSHKKQNGKRHDNQKPHAQQKKQPQQAAPAQQAAQKQGHQPKNASFKNDAQQKHDLQPKQQPNVKNDAFQKHQKHQKPSKPQSPKQNEQAIENEQNVLTDLGFVSDFKKRSKHDFSDRVSEQTDEIIDYSKAVPLRDQIYAPKKKISHDEHKDKEGCFEIIGVRFKEAGKIYYFDPDGKQASFGTPVIVETARGVEYGYTAIANRFVPGENIVSPLKKILRLATSEDKERLDANKALEKSAEEVFIEKVEKLQLPMTLVGVEYTFDNTKLLFYFSAETRIDFRELVKELASVFRTRIELRQVGVRDEAKMLGGLGVCGRPICCNTFLGEFAQVSIKMAKDQSLSLNSSKISGTCGRLLCCLRYEDEVYQQEYERTPKVDAIVETPEGKGVVVETNPLKGIVRVKMDDRMDAPPQAFHRDSVKIVGYIKRAEKNAETDAELAELEKE